VYQFLLSRWGLARMLLIDAFARVHGIGHKYQQYHASRGTKHRLKIWETAMRATRQSGWAQKRKGYKVTP
jgi:hypothetical protein